ncbi:AraC family transcriptional regulator [Aquimarina sp. I32.4]|uniref:helix-turn-helix domain-containing protein n=1 Tax=Aquimarina sp. I32.4 TaxID=2053903 RepID=UPI001304CED4|nr:helix-turn-helix transcriptional regulator [Aquimarina sp. I32.4]
MELFEEGNSHIDVSDIEKLFLGAEKNITITNFPNNILEKNLNKLKVFEQNQNYLKPNITISNLASELNTNSKYLSKTINIHKQKKFTQYINDLRIDYVLKKLDNDPTYSKYKIAVIAKKIGFNTPKAFSNSFFKKVGITPSEYIKILNS